MESHWSVVRVKGTITCEKRVRKRATKLIAQVSDRGIVGVVGGYLAVRPRWIWGHITTLTNGKGPVVSKTGKERLSEKRWDLLIVGFQTYGRSTPGLESLVQCILQEKNEVWLNTTVIKWACGWALREFQVFLVCIFPEVSCLRLYAVDNRHVQYYNRHCPASFNGFHSGAIFRLYSLEKS